MKQKNLYHVTTIDRYSSILKYGLIDNLCDGIYFTDSDDHSLNWIRQYKPNVSKFLLVYLDMDQLNPELIKIQHIPMFGVCYVYQGDIHPALLKFEEVVCHKTGEVDFFDLDGTSHPLSPVIPTEVRKPIILRFLNILTSKGQKDIELTDEQKKHFLELAFSGQVREEQNKNFLTLNP